MRRARHCGTWRFVTRAITSRTRISKTRYVCDWQCSVYWLWVGHTFFYWLCHHWVRLLLCYWINIVFNGWHLGKVFFSLCHHWVYFYLLAMTLGKHLYIGYRIRVYNLWGHGGARQCTIGCSSSPPIPHFSLYSRFWVGARLIRKGQRIGISSDVGLSSE